MLVCVRTYGRGYCRDQLAPLYDSTAAGQVDSAGIDVLLVGDSVGMVVHGHDTTLPVTVEARAPVHAYRPRSGCIDCT